MARASSRLYRPDHFQKRFFAVDQSDYLISVAHRWHPNALNEPLRHLELHDRVPSSASLTGSEPSKSDGLIRRWRYAIRISDRFGEIYRWPNIAFHKADVGMPSRQKSTHF